MPTTIRALLLFIAFVPVLSQGDDCAVCELGSNIWNGLADGVETLIDGGEEALQGLKDVWSPPALPPAQGFLDTPIVDPVPPFTAPSPTEKDSTSVDDDPIVVIGTPTPNDPNRLGSGEDDCDQTSSEGTRYHDQCNIATRQIIWPRICGDPVAEGIILAALTAIVPADQIQTCQRECGTFFWAAALTNDQISGIADLTVVEGVVPDSPGEYDLTPKLHRKGEVQLDSVAVESHAFADLSLISTPPGTTNPNRKYAYFPNAGQGVTTYVVDSGADPNNIDFTTHNVIKGWLYGMRAKREKTDADLEMLDQKGHGTCMASKIAGARNGLSRKTDLYIVKVFINLVSSIIDGLAQIIEHLKYRKLNGENVEGWTAVNFALSFPKTRMGINERRVELLIRELIEKFQAVVIVAAGNIRKFDAPFSDINRWPAILSLKPDLPIITVGAVQLKNGAARAASMGGPARTVSGPGEGWCAQGPGDGTKYSYGTSLACAEVTGVIADLLSRRWLRKDLGLDDPRFSISISNGRVLPNPQPDSIAQIIRDYVVRKSYPRGIGTDNVVWNGLYPERPDLLVP